MSKPSKKTPELRFKGFTDEWEQRKLGELAEIVRGASPRPIQDSKWFDDNSEIGWLRISDVTEQNGRIRSLVQKLSEVGQTKTRVILEPHLLLSIAATVGKPVINYVKTGVHDGFLIFMNPTFHQEYMFQWLEKFRPKWKKYGQPGSQVNLNSELVRNQDIKIPTFEEQIKISSFFKKLDETITLHQRKYHKIMQLKAAYLQDMITIGPQKIPNLRFDNFENHWEKHSLKKFIKYFPSKKSANSITEISEGPYPVYDANNVIGYINEYDQINDYISIIKDGAGVGRVTLRKGKSSIISTMGYLVPRKASKYFLYLLLQNFSFRKYITGTTIPHIYFKDYGKEKLLFPSIDEQEKIAELFRDIDKMANLYQNKVKKLKTLKVSYLQKMFLS